MTKIVWEVAYRASDHNLLGVWPYLSLQNHILPQNYTFQKVDS